jgi:outer membrane biosynthesis protein TonB
LIGLLFLGAGAVISWIAAGKEEPKPPVAAPVAPQPERVNPMAEQNLVLEEDKPVEEPAPTPEPTPVAKTNRGPKGGDWECSGEVAQAAAMKVINENRAQIRSCYERRLKVNNILQGDLRLRLKVGAGGKVTATSLSGSLKDSDVFTCVRNIAQAWTFAAPTGGNCAVVAVPFAFSPKR